ncbi:hypothetical protein POM88_033325 [Heracleum sosnowskyi]|uniref:Uncharacterized protein n=1 Tax=Heracleum sosnowskyi TaxID=360622 RepID=A0AAD8MLF9_9APIA|nr:hypothetical protein POM88_033325 [Heracleum sosnowskyi]
MATGIKETTLYTPLRGEEAIDDIKISEDENVTPFRNAGVLGRMTFWWLDPILKKGKVKVSEDGDLPKLQPADCAETCYSLFMEQLQAYFLSNVWNHCQKDNETSKLD